MEAPEQVTQAHRNGREFYITQRQLEKAEQGSIKVSYNQKGVPTNRFGEDPIALWAFGDQAETYGLWLRSGSNGQSIMEMPIILIGQDYVNKQIGPFVRKFWFMNLDDGSGLSGARDFNYGSRSRGIRNGSSSDIENRLRELEHSLRDSAVLGTPFEIGGETYKLVKC